MEKIDGGGKWDVWARNMLMSSGSDLFGKFSMIQVFYLRGVFIILQIFTEGLMFRRKKFSLFFTMTFSS